MTQSTLSPGSASLSTTEMEKMHRIRAAILQAGNTLRERHPWLVTHQNAIGMTIFWVSILGIIGDAIAYALGWIPAWLCIGLSAFWLSLLHELEHDLIHSLYFRKNPFWHNFMMWGVWIMRPCTINPFVRRRIHINHHKFSGTAADLEERGITNGTPWGVRRVLMMCDNLWSVALRPLEMRQMLRSFLAAQDKLSPAERRRVLLENLTGYFPLSLIHYSLWYLFLVYFIVIGSAQLLGLSVNVPEHLQGPLDALFFLGVVFLVPNMLRTFCIHCVSSNMHYYGDIENGNIIQQCQVWTSPLTWPLQLFCFNFAGTHAIHHFVVRDTFYIRQLTARKIYPVLRENGVRFNDFSSLFRANRWHPEASINPA